jgi:hypothetical protein
MTRSIAAALLLLASTDATLAQPGPPPRPKSEPPAAQRGPAQQPQAAANLGQALYLIRSTLLTLNDANRSGNYTVLRDLAAPAFQTRNTSADLAAIFADLRRRNFDLYAAAIIAPRLDAPPGLDRNGMLRLAGVFPTRPLQIRFDLLFLTVDGKWKLFGISVATPQAPADLQLSQPAPATKSK